MESITKKNSSLEHSSDSEINVGKPERVVSALTGGALIAYGLNRKDMTGILLSLLGGGLALRGATGHCEVYKKLGIDSADSDYWVSGKIDVHKAVTINKPLSEL